MSIWSNNPVLEREIRGRLRFKRRGGPQMVWIARLLGLIVVYYYARGILGVWHGTRQDARDFWPLLSYGALSLSVLLAPAIAATAITQEREQQTWEILATTRLSGAEILLGKWLGRQLIPWLMLVILLPFMAVCAARAQLGWLLLPSVLGFLLLTIACYSALGLLCSFQAKRTMTATASALMLSALLCLGTYIVSGVFGYLTTGGLNGPSFSGPGRQSPVLWANPFYVLGAMTDCLTVGSSAGQNSLFDPAWASAATFWYFLLSLGATIGALVFMVRRYHRAVRERN